jgi:hypothetical protein
MWQCGHTSQTPNTHNENIAELSAAPTKTVYPHTKRLTASIIIHTTAFRWRQNSPVSTVTLHAGIPRNLGSILGMSDRLLIFEAVLTGYAAHPASPTKMGTKDPSPSE